MWLYQYDPEMKQQSCTWVKNGTGPPKKAHTLKAGLKVMLIAFFDKMGMIFTHYVPERQTINAKYYKTVLMKSIRIHISQKQPKYCCSNFKLHRYDVRFHVVNQVLQFLATKNIEIVLHLPYSRDLVPCDFFLFPSMKNDLKGSCFTSWWIIGAVQAILKLLSNNDFETVFQQWETRSKKCIALGGE